MIKPEILRAIDEYNSRGWNCIPTITKQSGVFPAGAWREYSNKKQSYQDVIDLFTNTEHDGVAIVTGEVSDLVVLDVDLQKGADVQKFATEFIDSLICFTPSGGIHVYFKYKKGTTNRVDIVKGCDLRGDGGIVFAPPTKKQHGDYEWSNWDDGKLIELPTFVEEAIEENTRERATDEFMTKTVSKGGRNSHIARCAGYLIAQGLHEEIALNLLKGINAINVRPPLANHEVEHTFKSIKRTNDHRTKTLMRDNPNIPMEMNAGNGDFSLMNHEDFMLKYAESNVEWLIKDWMPAATMLFMVSPPESYKTWLEIDLAVSLAGGYPFLGSYPVEAGKQGPVILIQQEDWAGQTAKRIMMVHMSKLIAKGEAMHHIGEDGEMEIIVPPALPIYIHTESKLTLSDQKAMKGLSQAITEIKPVAVIIDPMYSITDADDSFMAKAPKQMMIFKQLRTQFGTSFVFAHHSGKESKAKNGNREHNMDRQRIWGSQLLNGFIETGWQCAKISQGVINVDRHFKAAQALQTCSLTFDISDVEPSAENPEGKFYYSVDVGNAAANGTEELEVTEAKRKTKAATDTMNPNKKTNSKDLTPKVSHVDRETGSLNGNRIKADGVFLPKPDYAAEQTDTILRHRRYIMDYPNLNFEKSGGCSDLPHSYMGVFHVVLNTKDPTTERLAALMAMKKETLMINIEKGIKFGVFKLNGTVVEITDTMKGLMR